MAGQTYFQPPDLIDLAVRSRLSHQTPYPPMTMPASSEKWRYPMPPAIPQNVDLCSQRWKRPIQQNSLAHLSVINRSSFHQTSHTNSQYAIQPPTLGQALLRLPDHASRYFASQAISEFQKGEIWREGMKNTNTTFREYWMGKTWIVWWWASSEDKARMKMERLRQSNGNEGY